MRINKFSMKSFFAITILALIGAIFLKDNSWLLNFCFAIFGSALLAFLTCLSSYIAQLKIISEEIAIKTYKYNIDSNAVIYSTKKEADIEILIQTLSVMHNDIYEVYQLTFDFQQSLFEFDKRKYIVEKFIKDIERLIQNIADIGSYIELNEQEAKANKKLIYKDISELIDNKDIYFQTLDIAKKFKGCISTRMDGKDMDKNKNEGSERYKRKIENK